MMTYACTFSLAFLANRKAASVDCLATELLPCECVMRRSRRFVMDGADGGGFDPLLNRCEACSSEIDNVVTLLYAAPSRPAPMSA